MVVLIAVSSVRNGFVMIEGSRQETSEALEALQEA